jgi:hypothetical protein
MRKTRITLGVTTDSQEILTRCPWVGPARATREDAEADAVWHVYEQHRAEWVSVVGNRPPTAHDPRAVN